MPIAIQIRKGARNRASILSMINVFDSIAIGISYLVYGLLYEFFQATQATALTCILPLVAAVLLRAQQDTAQASAELQASGSMS